jgi:hypothetical protein
MSDMDDLEEFWGDILSEEPLRIVAAWLTLDSREQITIRDHLTRMATDEGWAAEQRRAARSALNAIVGESEDKGGKRRTGPYRPPDAL